MEDKYKIIISNDFDKSFESELEKYGISASCVKRIDPKLNKDDLISKLKDANAVAVRSNPSITKEIIEAVAPSKTLEIVVRGGVGTDNIDDKIATKYGIGVCNTPEANIISVAERVMAFTLNKATELDFYDELIKRGIWGKKTKKEIGQKPKPTELNGKTMGIYGMGNIGKGVAKRAKAFGMKIIAYDPFASKDMAERMGIELVSLEKLVESSDYMTIHAPLTDETRNSINKELLSKAKDNLTLINTSRAPIMGDGAIEYLLENKSKSRISLDVYEGEKKFEENFEKGKYRFLQKKYHGRLKLSPHLGASTPEAERRVAQETAFNISELLLHGRLKNAINFPKIPEDVDSKYLDLADRIGYLCANIAQLEQGNKHVVGIEYTCYNELNRYTSLFGNFITKGVLRTRVPFTSTVNAMEIASEQGIEVKGREPYEEKDYNAITVDIITEENNQRITHSVRGKIGEEGPIIQRVDSYTRVNLVPKGDKFLIEYDNKRGMLSGVGSVIEKYANVGFVNITESPDKSTSFASFSTDQPLKEEVMKEIKEKLEAKGINVYLQKHVTFN